MAQAPYSPKILPEAVLLEQKIALLFKAGDDPDLHSGYFYEWFRDSNNEVRHLSTAFQDKLLFPLKALQIAATAANRSAALFPSGQQYHRPQDLYNAVFSGQLPFGIDY